MSKEIQITSPDDQLFNKIANIIGKVFMTVAHSLVTKENKWNKKFFI
jgi:hypothetical protein